MMPPRATRAYYDVDWEAPHLLGKKIRSRQADGEECILYTHTRGPHLHRCYQTLMARKKVGEECFNKYFLPLLLLPLHSCDLGALSAQGNRQPDDR